MTILKYTFKTDTQITHINKQGKPVATMVITV